MDELEGFVPIIDGAWYSTQGQRRKTLVATVVAAVLLLVSWFLLLVAYAFVLAGSAGGTDAERVDRIIDASVGWREWLSLVVGIAMWPLAVVISSRLMGLHGIGPKLVVAVGCLVLLALFLVGFVMVTAG